MPIYSTELQHAFSIARGIAKEAQHPQIAPPHLLHALMHNEVGLSVELAVIDKDIYYIREWAEYWISKLPKSSQVPEEPTWNDKLKATMEVADMMRLKLGEEIITPLAVLAAISRPNVAFSADELKTFILTEEELLTLGTSSPSFNATSGTKENAKEGNGANPTKNIDAKRPNLSKYCTEKTTPAMNGELDVVIGRDNEIRKIVETFGRRTKPNVLLIGESGVGKSAVVNGLAMYMIGNEAPQYLKGAKLFELDFGVLAAGASYKGEVEDRVRGIIQEIKQFDKAILFIDEIHNLMDSSGAFGNGVINLLKPELSRGEITLIGVTTLEEFRKNVEPDQAFIRRFETLSIEEPNVDLCIKMLKHLMPKYEEYHGVKVSDAAIEETVRLSKRYVKERKLPDSAIDILDRTMSAIRMNRETFSSELSTVLAEWETLKQDENTTSTDFKWFYRNLQAKIHPIMLSQIEDSPNEKDELFNWQNYLQTFIDKLQHLSVEEKNTTEKEDVAATVAVKTGIPIGKLQAGEQEKLNQMEKILQERVVGQDHAIQILSDAVLEARSGLNKAGQPIGSFFLLGPTGSGKTELAKTIADFLFNDENSLLRFDMSEFKEEHSAALLYGAPPGYVGYKEGGLLVTKIRQQPFSVVLFDEIEKAHSSVFDIFLQILDEGRLHDKLGREGDFSNALILFTSNIASDFITQAFKENRIPTSMELTEKMKNRFRPEFLGRLTDIIPFAPLSEQVAVKILSIHIVPLQQALSKQYNIQLIIPQEVKEYLVQVGFSPEFGARPLKGAIRNYLRKPLSKMLISGELKKDKTVTAYISENQTIQWNMI